MLAVAMKDWWPIALCNVLYKLVSKVLMNRLKRILRKCISGTQSTFVPGWSILDDALVDIELMHYLATKTWGQDHCVALKHYIKISVCKISLHFPFRDAHQRERSDRDEEAKCLSVWVRIRSYFTIKRRSNPMNYLRKQLSFTPEPH